MIMTDVLPACCALAAAVAHDAQGNGSAIGRVLMWKVLSSWRSTRRALTRGRDHEVRGGLRWTLVSLALVASACATSPTSAASKTRTSTSSTSTSTSTSTITVPAGAVLVSPTTIEPSGRPGGTVLLPATTQSPAEAVTLVKLIDPAQGADQFTTPFSDDRLVGVSLWISAGKGSQSLDDPAADTRIEDSQGAIYLPRTGSLLGCPGFPANLTTDQTGSLKGCLTFELPTTASVAEVLFTPGGQFGTVTAEWQPG